MSYESTVDASTRGRPARPPVSRIDRLRRPAEVYGIRLDPSLRKPRPDPSHKQPISVARLRHEPPAKARRLLVKAQEDANAGRLEKAAKRLEKAIRIDSEYIEAYNNLGVVYSDLGRHEDAVERLERAAELDPASPQPAINLTIALQALGETEAAIANAKRAVELAPYSAAAHLALGSVLVDEERQLSTAVRHLRRSAMKFPRAHLIAADALLMQGDADAAHAELRQYLAASPSKPVR